jgi:hypothetical protein
MEAMSRNRAILERYYSALQHKDADELRSSIEEGFAPDAVTGSRTLCRTAARPPVGRRSSRCSRSS